MVTAAKWGWGSLSNQTSYHYLLDRINSRIPDRQMQWSCTVNVPGRHPVVPVGAEEVLQAVNVSIKRSFMRRKSNFGIVGKLALKLSSFCSSKLLPSSLVELAVEKIGSHFSSSFQFLFFFFFFFRGRCPLPHPSIAARPHMLHARY